MKLNRFRRDGKFIETVEAVSREQVHPGRALWRIELSDGNGLHGSEAMHDLHHPGWRDLPEKP